MKALRIILAVFLVLLFALFGTLATVATNPRAMEFVVRQVLSRRAPDVQEFSIGSLRYSFPSSWTLGGVRATVLAQGVPVQLFAGQLEITDALHLLSAGNSASIEARDVEAACAELRVRGAFCHTGLIRSGSGLAYTGTVSVVDVSKGNLRASEIKADFSGNEQAAVLTNLAATVYGGTLSGGGRATLKPPVGYDAALSFNSIDCAQLEQALGGFFRQLGGTLSGQLHVAGTGNRVDVFDTAWNMPMGGAIGAELLASLTDYLPPSSAQKKRIDFLIRSGGKLAVEFFRFTLKNDSPEQLSGLIGIKSREANLELNVTHEIRVDTRIDSLWRAWQTALQ
ncbi:MAG: hypothetical protein IT583_07370 [Verrucomicrobia bacterium]|nr:hypothetical protein [Verrucomicrobiota bacterium]